MNELDANARRNGATSLAPGPDLGTAQDEEENHFRESRGILKAMRDEGTAMRHDAGFYRCPHGNH